MVSKQKKLKDYGLKPIFEETLNSPEFSHYLKEITNEVIKRERDLKTLKGLAEIIKKNDNDNKEGLK